MDAAAGNNIPGGLFGEAPAARDAASITKSELARRLGVTAGRISHFLKRGMPELPTGRIDLDAALAWYEENTDPARRKATKQPAPASGSFAPRGATAELNRVRAEREALKLEKDRHNLVERAAVERETYTRARAERDAWLGWVGRAATAIAADVGADPAATYAALDRLVREQLAGLSKTAIEDLAP